MLRISYFVSKIITAKHWQMPNADTGTFPELHVTLLQGSKTEYFSVYQLTNLLNIITFEFKTEPWPIFTFCRSGCKFCRCSNGWALIDLKS